ncbi:hypothetical protein MMC12_006914 [Toensbergia leucococca]|nr:hypothetical protein [Toensbergia leucococca]
MSASDNPTPISIHIPLSLSHLTVPLYQFIQDHRPKYDHLVVGAFIFAPSDSPATSPPRILLVQRAKTESAFPNLWEVPGGSSELADPTVLHSVAREVFEETGLRLTKFVRQIGQGVEFNINHLRWLKLSFEIEVAELPHQSRHSCHDHSSGHEADITASQSMDATTNSGLVTLDPKEHQQYVWATEEDIKKCYQDEGPYSLLNEAQRQVMLQAFTQHNAGNSQLKVKV